MVENVDQTKKLMQMKLPLNPPTIQIKQETDPEVWKIVASALSADLLKRVLEARLSPTTKKLLVRIDLPSQKELESMEMPKKDDLVSINTEDRVRGIIITGSIAGSKYDFISRYFAPWVGIPEDPVTGEFYDSQIKNICLSTSKFLLFRFCSYGFGSLLG